MHETLGCRTRTRVHARMQSAYKASPIIATVSLHWLRCTSHAHALAPPPDCFASTHAQLMRARAATKDRPLQQCEERANAVCAQMGMPFQCWVPWRLMTASIDEASFRRDAAAALQAIEDSVTPRVEARMRQLLRHFGRDVLWRHPRSRVADNVLLAAARWKDRGTPLHGCCPLPDEITE